MGRNILIERLHSSPVGEQAVEIVERKGLGHPDSICDAIMEAVSRALVREYLRRFGRVLHHNLDKGLLVAGRAEHRFGGGTIVAPMGLIFGDRATTEVGGEHIPVGDIAVDTAKGWLRNHLPEVDPERHVRYQVEIAPGSQALTEIFHAGTPHGLLGANDTSAAVGYAPLTETERLVRQTEAHLNSLTFKRSFPESGTDVKIMGFREGAVAAPHRGHATARPLRHGRRRLLPAQATAIGGHAGIRQRAERQPARGAVGVLPVAASYLHLHAVRRESAPHVTGGPLEHERRARTVHM